MLFNGMKLVLFEVKWRAYRLFAFLFASLASLSGMRAAPPDSTEIAKRLQDREITETIRGIIFYLYATQIIDRQGRRSCYYDATDAGD